MYKESELRALQVVFRGYGKGVFHRDVQDLRMGVQRVWGVQRVHRNVQSMCRGVQGVCYKGVQVLSRRCTESVRGCTWSA